MKVYSMNDFENEQICRRCNMLLDADAEFCKHCGCRVKRKPFNFKMLTIILIILVLGLSVGMVLLLTQGSNGIVLFSVGNSPTLPPLSAELTMTRKPTPKPTQEPTPSPTVVMNADNDNRQKYSLSSAVYTYDNFIDLYNTSVIEWKNRNTTSAMNLTARKDSSATSGKLHNGLSLRHQINENISLSTSLVGFAPYVSESTLICHWKNQETHDVVYLSAYALVGAITYSDKKTMDALDDMYQGRRKKEYSVTLGDQTIRILPYSNEVQVLLTYKKAD